MTEGEHTMVATHNFQRQLTDDGAKNLSRSFMHWCLLKFVYFEQQYYFMSLNMFGIGINSDSHHNSRFFLIH